MNLILVHSPVESLKFFAVRVDKSKPGIDLQNTRTGQFSKVFLDVLDKLPETRIVRLKPAAEQQIAHDICD